MATILKSKCSLFHILFSFIQSLLNLNMSHILPILKETIFNRNVLQSLFYNLPRSLLNVTFFTEASPEPIT